MYEAFDTFLAAPTWHRIGNEADKERFFQALHQVVKHADFSPEAMADYMRQKFNVPRGSGSYRDKAIRHYTVAARVVKDYLVAIETMQRGHRRQPER